MLDETTAEREGAELAAMRVTQRSRTAVSVDDLVCNALVTVEERIIRDRDITRQHGVRAVRVLRRDGTLGALVAAWMRGYAAGYRAAAVAAGLVIEADETVVSAEIDRQLATMRAAAAI